MITYYYHVLVMLGLVLLSQPILIQPFKGREIRYDWSTVPTDNPAFLNTLTFPKHFKFGVGDSAFQTEGIQGPGNKAAHNNWTFWQETTDDNGAPHIKDHQTIGNACERWTRYKEDIERVAECGFDMYRFSVEWSKIEPELGVFDQQAMAHYIEVCDEVIKHGIEPIITLFHHTWPTWFDKQGAFEEQENNKHFVEFCRYVFERLHTKVRTWVIFNEPAGYVMQGYYRGKYPPGKKDFKLAGRVLNNMLQAHVQTYYALKAIDPQVAIGIAHIFQPLDPYHPWNPLERLACALFDPLVNDVVLDYFKTGTFTWRLPGKSVTDTNKKACGALDFLGINYYSHTVLCGQWDFKNILAPTKRSFEEVSDDNKIIYPEGLMRALEKGAQLGIPMYVMENGISDAIGRIRARFINQHLYVTALAARTYDIRGYFYWTLMDNFEWNEGYNQAYGLFACNHQTQERTLRESAQPFITFLQNRKQYVHAREAGI